MQSIQQMIIVNRVYYTNENKEEEQSLLYIPQMCVYCHKECRIIYLIKSKCANLRKIKTEEDNGGQK